MNSNYTDITVILDRSGSMLSIQKDMEGGLNSLFEEQKKLDGVCKVSLYQFDTEYESVFEGKDIKDVPEVKLLPRGGTALLDAIGKTINSVGLRLSSMNESERPGKVVVIIITDGQENSSVEFKKPQVFDMITLQRETYNWQFVFLGANQDAIEEAGSLGVMSSSSATYSSTSLGAKRIFYAVSQGMADYRTGASSGCVISEDAKLEQEELIKQFGH